ncbi:MAG: putative Na+/H+ antiporter [Cryobacterium sp.]|nr:putative Na+/H+ antiporter [Oligoflexia bacterium]
MPHSLEIVASILFAVALIHTFLAAKFSEKAHESTGLRSNFYHLLGEVEVVFGLWAAVFILSIFVVTGPDSAIAYVEKIDFTEAAFVFVIMAVAATKSIRELAERGIDTASRGVARAVPFIGQNEAFFLVTLILGPLLGSLITEPAAMTVCALILRERFFTKSVSERFKYKTIALLFVNISIGGVLTHFAAPPVVMVAKTWGWDTPFMFFNFGYKAAIAVVINSAFTLTLLRKELKSLPSNPIKPADSDSRTRTSAAITIIHLVFLALIVLTAHYITFFMGIFLLFIGVMTVTEPHQEPLQLRESLLVGFFLAGLVVLGKPQSWWISPLIQSLSQYPLYFGATALTAFTDNAALTFLGAQVPNLAPSLKVALVAGAVSGGGLTVIANAPNPAGYGILKSFFGPKGIQPGKLLQAALVPTIIASLCLELL